MLNRTPPSFLEKKIAIHLNETGNSVTYEKDYVPIGAPKAAATPAAAPPVTKSRFS